MDGLLLGLCLLLALACGVAKWRVGLSLSRWRARLSELASDRQQVVRQEQQLSLGLEYLQIQERELRGDVRDLTAEFKQVNDRIEELEADEERVKRRRPGEGDGQAANDDAPQGQADA